MPHFYFNLVIFKKNLFLFLVVRFFQEYTEPEEGGENVSQPHSRRDFNPLHPSPAGPTEEENVLLPLPENTLNCNLGIPVVVVVTKVSITIFLCLSSLCMGAKVSNILLLPPPPFFFFFYHCHYGVSLAFSGLLHSSHKLCILILI